MRRPILLLAAALALTGCRIEEAEYFDPTQSGFRMFQYTNSYLSDQADIAACVMLFNLYYSAPEEERETLHDRYFYTSRIVSSGDEWRIIDSNHELIVYTDGQPLSTEGATWEYAYSFQNHTGDDLPTIVCRADEAGLSYDLRLPDGGGELSFTATYCSQPQEPGTICYWCELLIGGRGEYDILENYNHRFEKIAYRIAEPLKYASNRAQRFGKGSLQLTTQTDDGLLEAQAEYLGDDRVRIRYGEYAETYWYR